MRRTVLTSPPSAAVAVGWAAAAATNQQRSITTKGQFNPLHRFAFDADTGLPLYGAPRDAKEFRRMVTNPGAMRISYSPDYLDWYYKAYTARAKHAALKAKAKVKYPWASPKAADAVAAAAALGDGSTPAGSLLASAPLKAYTSPLRQAQEVRMARALDAIETASVQHGVYDVAERQSQFPQIHVDQATDFHIRAMAQKYLVEPAISVEVLWRKALLYRALLLEKKNAYPASFEYAMKWADSCQFAKPAAAPSTVATPAASDAAPAPSAETTPAATGSADDAHLKMATSAHAEYFRQLVRMYHIDNAVDAHVVLECHLQPDAESLLLSNPPPREDVVDAAGKPLRGMPVWPAAQPLPSLAALFSDDNLPLLRCLVFGEFNLQVTCDPFLKYPRAKSFVTRPSPSELSQGRGAAELINEKRTSFLAPLTMPQQNAVDARSKDVARLEAAHSKQDAMFDHELSKLADEEPALWSAAESAAYNPRTVRAEIRDRVARRVLAGLREYEKARAGIHRPATIFEMESSWRNRGTGYELPLQRPTIPHFLHLIVTDPHVSFLMAMLSDAQAHKSVFEGIRSAAVELATQMFKLGLEFPNREARRLHAQKVKVAASLLDMAIKEATDIVRTDPQFGGSSASGGLLASTPAGKLTQSLGDYVPWAARPLDEAGFPSAAKFDDLSRWMKALPVVKSSAELPRPPAFDAAVE